MTVALMIKGKTIVLYEKTETGVDSFGMPIYSEEAVEVENVLVQPASNDAIVNDFELNGKHLAYVLHIPKGDSHEWRDSVVEFNNQKWRTYGDCLEYDEDMTPLAWNKQVKVERYE